MYVDAVEGTSNNDCGQDQRNPCKQLSVAIERVDSGGIVLINGDQVLSETIPLLMDIVITTTQQHRGRIIGHGEVPIAFDVQKEGIILRVRNISFHNIGIAQISNTIMVFTSNILVTGGYHTVFNVRQRLSKMRLTMSVSNSAFIDTGIVLDIRGNWLLKLGSSKVNVRDCSFNNTGGMKIYEMKGLLVKIGKCSFHHHLVRIVSIQKVYRAYVQKSRFVNTSRGEGFLFLGYFVFKSLIAVLMTSTAHRRVVVCERPRWLLFQFYNANLQDVTL